MNTIEYGGVRPVDRTHTLFGQVMWYAAATAGLFALGAYLGRNLGYGVALVCYLLAFACLIGMRFAVRRSAGLSVALLFGFGLLMGLALSPTLVYYAGADPQALWQASGATALFVAGFGAAGYATRRDLSALARVAFWALLALIVYGIVLIFVHIPGGVLVYSVLGLVIFAGLTMVDPAAAPIDRPGLRTHNRGVDLPGRAERVPVLPADLRPPAGLSGTASRPRPLEVRRP
jgi:FtsH-binding integral membrane protein